MASELPPIIRLSYAIIDREARIIIEWDLEKRDRIWIDNGTNKYFYDGDDAKLLWNFYHPERPENWLDRETGRE